jgi:uncharacterized DUF497 family protein
LQLQQYIDTLKYRFDWDPAKNTANQRKHFISFEEALSVFADRNRLFLEDSSHSHQEARYFCIGQITRGVATVRFTLRNNVIRIFGAAFWRKGKKLYASKQN